MTRTVTIQEYIKDAIARLRYQRETRQFSDAYLTKALIRYALTLRHKPLVIEVKA